MPSRFARILTIAILLLCASETLIVAWLSVLVRGAGLSPLEWLAIFAALVAFNYIAFPQVRRRLRAQGVVRVVSRGWILGSIGALVTGVMLALVWPLGLGASWTMGLGDSHGLLVAWLGGGVVVLGFGSVAWGASLGQSRVRVEAVAVPIAYPSPELESVRIAHVTDLHIGPLLGPARLRSFVRQINALEPDLIAVTGDIFDFDPAYIEEGCRELAKLEAKRGVYAILGNHDIYTGADRVAAALADLTPIRLLRNEWDLVPFGQTGLTLAGIEDPGTGWTERVSQHDELDRLVETMPDDLPSVLLAHRPSWFAHAARLGVDVVLSGHTHGGQVSLPMIPNLNLSRLIAHHTRGLYLAEGSAMYVSRGIGVAGLPLRINCSREIALIRLTGQESSRMEGNS